MLYLIKSENIFVKFCKNVYTIEYQKHSLFYMHFLIFLYLVNLFFETFQIYKFIYAKLPIVETNLIGKLIRIIISIILHSFYKNINLYLFYISNA